MVNVGPSLLEDVRSRRDALVIGIREPKVRHCNPRASVRGCEEAPVGSDDDGQLAPAGGEEDTILRGTCPEKGEIVRRIADAEKSHAIHRRLAGLSIAANLATAQ